MPGVLMIEAMAQLGEWRYHTHKYTLGLSNGFRLQTELCSVPCVPKYWINLNCWLWSLTVIKCRSSILHSKINIISSSTLQILKLLALLSCNLPYTFIYLHFCHKIDDILDYRTTKLGGLICLQPPISEGEGQRLFFFTGVNGVR